jgi:hypothetical protein
MSEKVYRTEISPRTKYLKMMVWTLDTAGPDHHLWHK